MTGDGTDALALFLRYYDAGYPTIEAWLDIAYSIDAPEIMPAGSYVRDEVTEGVVLVRESWSLRP